MSGPDRSCDHGTVGQRFDCISRYDPSLVDVLGHACDALDTCGSRTSSVAGDTPCGTVGGAIDCLLACTGGNSLGERVDCVGRLVVSSIMDLALDLFCDFVACDGATVATSTARTP